MTLKSSHQRWSVKKGVLKKFTNFTGNTCVVVSFQKRIQHRCFPVKFTEFLRIPILKDISKWLFLDTLFSNTVKLM